MKYLDPDALELGTEFDAVLPVLWLMSGGFGPMTDDPGPWLLPPGGCLAVLFDETRIKDFVAALTSSTTVQRVFLVTDSEESYAEMVQAVGDGWPTSMLYRDYLRNFRINTEGNL